MLSNGAKQQESNGNFILPFSGLCALSQTLQPIVARRPAMTRAFRAPCLGSVFDCCPAACGVIEMGLNEKRKMKEVQDTALPERTRELLEITGGPIAYDVDWP